MLTPKVLLGAQLIVAETEQSQVSAVMSSAACGGLFMVELNEGL